MNVKAKIKPSAETPSEEDERISCKFGIKCSRKNPAHRLEIAHPGDADYLVPDMPEPNDDAVDCKYKRKCYRLNPDHFKNFRHPRNINIQKNYARYVLKRQTNRRNSGSSFDYDVSDDDPFAGDSDSSEYQPSDSE